MQASTVSTSSTKDVEICSPVKTPETGARGILRGWLAAGDGRGQGLGTSSKVQALRVMGFFAFLSPQQIQILAPLLVWYSAQSD